jgi:hypothetical protein
MNKKQYKEFLDDICDGHDCILKEFIISAHPSPRLLMQLKCVERYKKLKENVDCVELTMSEAMTEWVTTGKAKIFADVYNENKKYLDIYKEVMNYGK